MEKGADIYVILKEVPILRNSDKETIRHFTLKTVKELEKNGIGGTNSEELFVLYIETIEDLEAKRYLCEEAPEKWLFSSPICFTYLDRARVITIIKSFDWKDESNKNLSRARMLSEYVLTSEKSIKNAFYDSLEKAWLDDQSALWSALPKKICQHIEIDF